MPVMIVQTSVVVDCFLNSIIRYLFFMLLIKINITHKHPLSHTPLLIAPRYLHRSSTYTSCPYVCRQASSRFPSSLVSVQKKHDARTFGPGNVTPVNVEYRLNSTHALTLLPCQVITTMSERTLLSKPSLDRSGDIVKQTRGFMGIKTRPLN